MAKLYLLFQPLIFKLPAETAHHLGLFFVRILGFLHRIGLVVRPQWATDIRLETPSPFGKLYSPLGLAAGFDKNAIALWGWQALGFAFVEVGTITPLPQPGNEKPRMFRVSKFKALVNRLGFNNDGMEVIGRRIKKAKAQGLRIKVGGNIGKNFSTSLQDAAHDYRKTAHQIQAVVDYLVINVSSPNTPGLRDMQAEEFLDQIVGAVRREAQDKPLFIKLAPDQYDTYMAGVLKMVEKYSLSGVICGNTLLNHAASSVLSSEEVVKLPKGGLSGQPVFENNLRLASSYGKQCSFVIGVGGIASPNQAMAYLESGCKLIQVYTGFIYQGPKLVQSILEEICNIRSHK